MSKTFILCGFWHCFLWFR